MTRLRVISRGEGIRGIVGAISLAAAFSLGPFSGTGAQVPEPPIPSPQGGAELVDPTLRGVLLLGGVPADSGTVVLHRVTPEEAGAVDSVQVGSDGRFEIALPAVPQPGSGEVFFASNRYEGILYFGVPITAPVQLDSLYEVNAWETRAAPEAAIPFAVGVRNIFIDLGPMGWRATDLFEIRNDSSVTWIPEPEERAVWSYPLPPGATGFRTGQSDLAEDAVRFEGGAVHVHAAVPPGTRLFVIQYELADIEFTLPLPGRTEILEVLVQDPAPPLRMEGLRADQPVELEPGSVYLRWTGDDLVDRAVRIERGEDRDEFDALLPWAAVVLSLVLLGASFLALRRPRGAAGDAVPSAGGLPLGTRGGTGPTSAASRPRAALLLAVARLDEEFEGVESPNPEQDAAYRAERKSLLAELASLPGSASAGALPPGAPPPEASPSGVER